MPWQRSTFGRSLRFMGGSFPLETACSLLSGTGASLIGLGVGGIKPTLTYASVFLAVLLSGPDSIDEYVTDTCSSEYVVIDSTDVPAES